MLNSSVGASHGNLPHVKDLVCIPRNVQNCRIGFDRRRNEEFTFIAVIKYEDTLNGTADDTQVGCFRPNMFLETDMDVIEDSRNKQEIWLVLVISFYFK
jgi:hypothetical protein